MKTVKAILAVAAISLWGCASAETQNTKEHCDSGGHHCAHPCANHCAQQAPCAESAFAVCEIDSVVFSRMYGKSYKENCPVPLEELRYVTVLHYTPEGEVKKGELVCNKAIANDLVEIFQVLYDNKYPIERMQLIDDFDADDETSMWANNTSSFCYRTIAGSNKISKHGLGLAIDINPLYNPYVKKRDNGTNFIQPSIAEPYVDRNADFPMKIDKNDLCYKEFVKHGFEWGGDWTSLKDYQHFEKDIK